MLVYFLIYFYFIVVVNGKVEHYMHLYTIGILAIMNCLTSLTNPFFISSIRIRVYVIEQLFVEVDG